MFTDVGGELSSGGINSISGKVVNCSGVVGEWSGGLGSQASHEPCFHCGLKNNSNLHAI